jgi:hypothetical protein
MVEFEKRYEVSVAVVSAVEVNTEFVVDVVVSVSVKVENWWNLLKKNRLPISFCSSLEISVSSLDEVNCSAIDSPFISEGRAVGINLK